jgi:hypothetical protein
MFATLLFRQGVFSFSKGLRPWFGFGYFKGEYAFRFSNFHPLSGRRLGLGEERNFPSKRRRAQRSAAEL